MTKIIALCKLHWIKANAIHKVEVLKNIYIYTHTLYDFICKSSPKYKLIYRDREQMSGAWRQGL